MRETCYHEATRRTSEGCHALMLPAGGLLKSCPEPAQTATTAGLSVVDAGDMLTHDDDHPARR